MRNIIPSVTAVLIAGILLAGCGGQSAQQKAATAVKKAEAAEHTALAKSSRDQLKMACQIYQYNAVTGKFPKRMRHIKTLYGQRCAAIGYPLTST